MTKTNSGNAQDSKTLLASYDATGMLKAQPIATSETDCGITSTSVKNLLDGLLGSQNVVTVMTVPIECWSGLESAGVSSSMLTQVVCTPTSPRSTVGKFTPRVAYDLVVRLAKSSGNREYSSVDRVRDYFGFSNDAARTVRGTKKHTRNGVDYYPQHWPKTGFQASKYFELLDDILLDIDSLDAIYTIRDHLHENGIEIASVERVLDEVSAADTKVRHSKDQCFEWLAEIVDELQKNFAWSGEDLVPERAKARFTAFPGVVTCA